MGNITRKYRKTTYERKEKPNRRVEGKGRKANSEESQQV